MASHHSLVSGYLYTVTVLMFSYCLFVDLHLCNNYILSSVADNGVVMVVKILVGTHHPQNNTSIDHMR